MRRHLLGGARGEAAGVAFGEWGKTAESERAMDKRTAAADSVDAADSASDGKVNDVRLCCGGGVPIS